MKSVQETVDVIVAGGGTAGHVAAIQAARAGVKTSVIEAGSMVGGTMTAGGVYMPNHFFSTTGPVVQGIAWELYTKSKAIEGLPVPDFKKRRPLDTPGYYSYINVPIYAALAEEEAVIAGVVVHFRAFQGLDPEEKFPHHSCRPDFIGRTHGAGRHPRPMHLYGHGAGHGGGGVPGG